MSPNGAIVNSPSISSNRPERAIYRIMTRVAARQGIWVWAIAIAVTATIPLVVDHYGGEPMSVFSTAVQGPRWYLFVTILVVTAASIGPSVAQGMTRRAFVRELGSAGLVTGVGFGVVAGLVHVAEHALHLARGWPHISVYGGRPVPAEPWWLILLDHAVVLVVFALSGLAVAAVYYRWRGWLGTLALPLTAGPVFVVPALLDHVEPVELGTALDEIGYPFGLALSLGTAAALWAAAHLALRGAPVRPSPLT